YTHGVRDWILFLSTILSSGWNIPGIIWAKKGYFCTSTTASNRHLPYTIHSFMLVAIYNRTFDEENIPRILNVLELLERHNLKMVFHKEFYERIAPHMTLKHPPA